MRCTGYLSARLPVSCPFTRHSFQDTHAMQLLKYSNTSHEASKSAQEACRGPSDTQLSTAVTIHPVTHQSPPMDKNAPPQAQNVRRKPGARQSHSIGLQWKVHSDARTDSFCPVCNITQGRLRMSKIKMRCITCGKWFQSANAKEVTCPDCMQKARKEKLAAKSTPPTSSKSTGPGAPGTGSAARPTPPPPKPKPASGETSRWFDSVEDVKVGEPDQPQRQKLPFSPTPRDDRSGSERMGNRGPGGYRDDRGPGGYREDRGPGGYREGGNRGPGGYREDRGPGGYRDDRGNRGPGGYREDRNPGGYRVGGGSGIAGGIGQRPRQPMEGGYARGPRPGEVGEPRRDRYPGGNRGGKPEQKVKKPKPAAPPRPKREKIR